MMPRFKSKTKAFLLVSLSMSLILISICYAKNQKISWNDRKIKWFSYEQGMRMAQRTKKPVILIFYADWCPTCHNYSKLFQNKQVVSSSYRFVMIRVNTDTQSSLSKQYNLDGGYVPRTFALFPNGRIMNDIYPPKEHKYYLGVNVNNLLSFMQSALKRL